jgi:hypothetical protein
MLTPDNIIHRAVRQAHEAGQRAALDRAFSALGRSIVEPVLTKAHELAQPQPGAPQQHEPDPHAALLLAQLDHAIRCIEQRRDPKPGDAALRALWHEPDALAGVVGQLRAHPKVQKAIAYALYLKAAERAPKGGISLNSAEGTGVQFYPGGQWIPAQVIANLAPEQRKQLDDAKGAAAPAGQKPVRGKESAPPAAPDATSLRRKVAEIASDILLKPAEHTPDKFRDLAEAVAAGIESEALTKHDMVALKLRLSATFGDQRQIVALLLAHAEQATREHEAVTAAAPQANAGAQTPPSPNEASEPPPVPTTPAPGEEPKPNSFALLPTDAISVDPARFQFKLRTDESGVTAELKQVKQFNPDFAGVISVWYEPETGKTWCVNGHHRRELAHRTGFPHLMVHYLEAKDAREARAKGALVNIAEGRGTALDAAKFLRDSGRTGQDLFDLGVSPDGVLARDAATLTQLNDAAFDRLARGALDQNTALAVAKHLADPARQEKLFKLIAKHEENGKEFTNKHVEEMARQMASAPSATTTTSTLWGDETNEDDTFVERADLASHVRGELAKEHHDYGALSSERRAGATKEAGNVLNVEENKRRAAEADVNRHAFDTLAHNKGAVSDALDAGAVALKQAKTKREKENARRQTLAAVRTAVADAAAGRQPGGQTADGGGMEGVGGVRPEGGEAERATASETGAGQTAEDGGGPRDAAAGLAAVPEPPAPAAVPEPSLPNEPPSAASAATTPLQALAHLAGNPDALKAESERLAGLANKTRAQGGSLEFHDAMTAALRGEHGPEVRDAVSRGLDDWTSHQGGTAKRYARAAEEVAKIGQQQPEESTGGKEGEPQAETAEVAPAEAKPEEALGKEESSPLEKLAESAIPRESLERMHERVGQYPDLHEHGYDVSHWREKRNPENQVLEYNPHDGSKPRVTAKTSEEAQAVHEALGLPAAKEEAAKPGEQPAVELPDVPVEDVPRALAPKAAGAAPTPSSPNVPSSPRGGRKRKTRAPEPATNYAAEAHDYSVESGKNVTQQPGMNAVELAKAAHAANPALPAEHAARARSSHVPALMGIPKNDSRFVAGHRVRRLANGKFQVERKGGFLTGTAKDVSEHIRSSWVNQEGYESLPSALGRAAKYDEPDPFTDVGRASEDAKLRDEIPEGTRAVSLDDDTKGRVGVVKRDAETGSARLVLDGGEETKATDFEPLDAAHSWRAPKAERAARRPKGGKTGDLFEAEAGEPEPAKSEEPKAEKPALGKKESKPTPPAAREEAEPAALFGNEKDNLLSRDEAEAEERPANAVAEPSSPNEPTPAADLSSVPAKDVPAALAASATPAPAKLSERSFAGQVRDAAPTEEEFAAASRPAKALGKEESRGAAPAGEPAVPKTSQAGIDAVIAKRTADAHRLMKENGWTPAETMKRLRETTTLGAKPLRDIEDSLVAEHLHNEQEAWNRSRNAPVTELRPARAD